MDYKYILDNKIVNNKNNYDLKSFMMRLNKYCSKLRRQSTRMSHICRELFMLYSDSSSVKFLVRTIPFMSSFFKFKHFLIS